MDKSVFRAGPGRVLSNSEVGRAPSSSPMEGEGTGREKLPGGVSMELTAFARIPEIVL